MHTSHIDRDLARGIARGDVDPISYEPIVDISPSHQPKQRPARPQPLSFIDENKCSVSRSKNAAGMKGTLLQYFSG
jgi:hypothetical protein